MRLQRHQRKYFRADSFERGFFFQILKEHRLQIDIISPEKIIIRSVPEAMNIIPEAAKRIKE
jgi:hypothetical protein